MKEKVEITLRIDKIENGVYKAIRAYGFKKHGRTLHRFVSGDISQVINFQCGQAYRGETHRMWVNLGIRIPECSERAFILKKPIKRYYHEYECSIRSRLGSIDGGQEKCFDLREDAEKIQYEIIDDIENKVMPVFDVLSSRENILARRRDYPNFDLFNRNKLPLEEAMIYGHLGDMEKAKELFEQYYQTAMGEYNDAVVNGRKVYLKKGERLVYAGQDITAEQDGYVTIYGASRAHIDYLDELAATLGLR